MNNPFNSPVHNQYYNNIYYWLKNKYLPEDKAHFTAVAHTRKHFNLVK